jgi:hypothetical protein
VALINAEYDMGLVEVVKDGSHMTMPHPPALFLFFVFWVFVSFLLPSNFGLGIFTVVFFGLLASMVPLR